jgi:hypothetical protein
MQLLARVDGIMSSLESEGSMGNYWTMRLSTKTLKTIKELELLLQDIRLIQQDVNILF